MLTVKSHKFLSRQRDVKDYTLLPNHSSFAVTMYVMSPGRKHLLLTTTPLKLAREVDKRSNMLVFLYGCLEAS